MNKENLQMAFKVLFVFGGAYLAFKALTPKPRKSTKIGNLEVVELAQEERPFIQPPPLMDESQAQTNPKSSNAHLALSVYIDAMNSGATTAELDKVNSELSNDLGLKVYRRRSDNKIVVKDLNDNDVMEYDAEAANATGEIYA